MARIFGDENMSCNAASTWLIPTSAVPFFLDCESAISTALRQMSRQRRASPETAATFEKSQQRKQTETKQIRNRSNPDPSKKSTTMTCNFHFSVDFEAIQTNLVLGSIRGYINYWNYFIHQQQFNLSFMIHLSWDKRFFNACAYVFLYLSWDQLYGIWLKSV